MIGLTHTEAMTVVKMKAAIAAANDLVIHLNRHSGEHGLSPGTVERIVEADFILNTAEDDFINDDPEMRIT